MQIIGTDDDFIRAINSCRPPVNKTVEIYTSYSVYKAETNMNIDEAVDIILHKITLINS